MTLVNLGDLAKPATVLIEKVADAIDGIARPYQIERIAKAEGRAEVARANTRIEISEIEERALQRMVREEGKRQENIETIALSAAERLGEGARPQDIENDWIVHLFEKGRLISDSEMQMYWASMLAGEAEQPGKFSKRTIDLLAGLDKSDIRLFTKFARCVWFIERPAPIVTEIPSSDTATSMCFDKLKHLESIGLLHVSDVQSPFAMTDCEVPQMMNYFGEAIEVTPQAYGYPSNTIELGPVLLTSSGIQLYPLCCAEYSEAHYKKSLQTLIDKGYLPRQHLQKTAKT